MSRRVGSDQLFQASLGGLSGPFRPSRLGSIPSQYAAIRTEVSLIIRYCTARGLVGLSPPLLSNPVELFTQTDYKRRISYLGFTDSRGRVFLCSFLFILSCKEQPFYSNLGSAPVIF